MMAHNFALKITLLNTKYRISANSFLRNYSFLEVGVRQVFKVGNFSFLIWKL